MMARPRLPPLMLLLLLLLLGLFGSASGFLLFQHQQSHHRRPLPQSVAVLGSPRAGGSYQRRFPLQLAGRAAGPGQQQQEQHDGDTGDDDQKVIARVQAWVRNMVIGLRLCPFAEGVVVADTVKYLVSKGQTPTGVVTDVMTEALKLVTTKEELVATTVIIAPFAFIDDFPAFYETELFLEEHLEESPLGEDVLVACFHPQYEFGGEPADAPIHFEKRSPYPIFNLLRAQRVWEYADEGKTQRIAANNQETLSRTGIAEVRRRFALEAPEAPEGEGDGS